MIDRRKLFGFLAVAPVAAVGAVTRTVADVPPDPPLYIYSDAVRWRYKRDIMLFPWHGPVNTQTEVVTLKMQIFDGKAWVDAPPPSIIG